MNSEFGKYFIVIGLLVLAAGAIIYFFHDKMPWIGHLPGDIIIERKNFRFYFPITTMILFSLIVTIVLRLFKKF